MKNISISKNKSSRLEFVETTQTTYPRFASLREIKKLKTWENRMNKKFPMVANNSILKNIDLWFLYDELPGFESMKLPREEANRKIDRYPANYNAF